MMENRNSTTAKNPQKMDLSEVNQKKKILKDLDLFVLDNSIRETTVGQLRGHTIQNKWEIYNEVKKVGFDHTIVAAFSHSTRVGDVFIEQLREKGEDMSKMYAFTELSDQADENGVPVNDLPIGLEKCKKLGIPNPIIEIDLAYFGFNYELFNTEKFCELLDKRIEWIRKELTPDAKIYVNLRDFSDGMAKAPERVFAIVRFLSTKRPKIQGILYEEFGANFPEELGEYTRAIKDIMVKAGFSDGHLLIHIHHQWGLSDASVLECLANGANGIWAGLCEEGAAMGHASTVLTVLNLIRLGNTKVIKKFNCQELRNCAINMTKIVTGNLPPPKTVVVGERALDQAFGFPAFDPELMEGFQLNKFFGEEYCMRITELASDKIIRDGLIDYFGENPEFTLEIAGKMKEKILEDLNANRKEEYTSCVGLALLFDRSGGQLTEEMSERIAQAKISNLHIQTLIDEIREQWDEWDLKDNAKIDDKLDFNAFYNGFMGPYFGCYRCDETTRALRAIDMDKDGWVDWNEFLLYLKWAGHQYPKVETAQGLLDIAFRKGLLPAMQDVLLDIVQKKKQ